MNKAEQPMKNSFGFYSGLGDRNIFVYPVPTHDYVIYIDDLSYLEDHQERLQTIRMASPEDTIRLIINSPGGVVSIAMAYVSAIAESSANIVTHAEGNVCSAGTVLWLASEERTVSPLTMFMFHNYQGGTWGDGANMHSQIIFERAYFERLVEFFYGGVLTEEEIARIKGGGQVWMDEVEILKRTKAVLLDRDNISRMKEGQSPIIQPSGLEKLDVDTEKEKEPGIYLKVSLDNEEFSFLADSITEEDLVAFSNKELYAILVQIAEGCGDTLDKDEVSSRSSRKVLVQHLIAYGKTIARLSSKGQGK